MDNEAFAFLVSAMVAIAAAVRWYRSLFSLSDLGDWASRRVWLAVVPVLLLGGLEVVIVYCAAREVRHNPGYNGYNLLFLLGGAAWLGLTGAWLPVVGLSARSDVLEARNAAAAVALCGAWTGMMLCYAGANVGEGPTVWTTYGPAALAGGALLGLWLILEVLTRVSDAITIEWDTTSGIRLAGFLIAAGLVLGRGVAGDWHSWNGTLRDFLNQGWPALALMIATGTFQIVWGPKPRRTYCPVVSRGIVPALFLLGAAAADLWLLGRP